jgi:hypothetical protein
VPEGYAFYALHPRLYAAGARRLPKGDWRVIGIRSIGTSLAAVVAAAVEAPPPVTVRPVGHPFGRELRLSPALAAEWAAHDGPFVVVDEGPGLSGSSFGAVADALEALGVASGRIAFLPGHAGALGPQASHAHRLRWTRADRPVAAFEAEVLPALADAAARLVGPATRPMQDISGGAWRGLRSFSEPPPVHPGQERRKFLHHAESGPWLIKFAGLGRIGRAKLERARALHAAGYGAEPAGLIEGFLVERWEAGASLPEPGAAFLDRLGGYLAFRSRAFTASEPGSDLDDLLEMVRVNAGEALGPDAGTAVLRRAGSAAALKGRMRPVHVDGRLHRWEWVVLPGGGTLKTDALDHSEAHDLIGPQDIAWDLAGAEVEFDLGPDQAERLRERMGADSQVLDLCRLAYPAFQLGLWTLAAEAQADGLEEGGRARAQAGRYARRLAALLEIDPPARPG